MFIALLCSLSDDNRDLVEKIFKQNKNKFYNIALSYLKSDANAKDAVSESMIKIMNNVNKIAKLSCPQLNAFCVTIVRNTCIDMLRKENKILLLDKDELEQKMDETQYFEENTHNIEQLFSIVNKLSEEEKKLIYLRFGMEKGFKEIATILNISEETAKKRGQRVLAKLKVMMESEIKQ